MYICTYRTSRPFSRHLLQGNLAHKKTPPPRTLQSPHAKGPMVVLGVYERGTPVALSHLGLHTIPKLKYTERSTHIMFY